VGLHLVATLRGWALELQLGRAATEPAEAEDPGDAYTGLVVDAADAPRYMGFTNGLDTGGPHEDWRHE